MVDKKEEENENIDNPSEYSAKSDFSKAEVVRLQVQKVNEIRSKEMREGYYNSDRLGNQIYVPDSRKEFISSVKALRNLLDPEIRRDKSFQNKEEVLLKKKEGATETFGVLPVKTTGTNLIVETESKKYIPHLGEKVPVRQIIMKHYRPVSAIIEYIPGIYDRNHHNYWNFLVEVYDLLLAELNSLMDRCNYFKPGLSF